MRQYKVEYRGEVYSLSLRLSSDGYVTMWQRLALQRLMRGAALLQYPFASEEEANEFFGIVLVEAHSGVALRSDGIPIPLPWKQWTELDQVVMEEIARDFFVDSLTRMQQSRSSESSTSPFSLERMLTVASIFRTSLGWPLTLHVPQSPTGTSSQR